jgi:hypothetical protein
MVSARARKSFAEMARARLKDGDSTLADMIVMAKRLHRVNPKTGKRLSLPKIATRPASSTRIIASRVLTATRP